MSAQRDEAFKQWKNGFIRHYEPLTSVEAFVGGWNSRDAEVVALQAKLIKANVKLLNVLQGHNISGIAGQVIIDLQAKLTELREQNRALLANANHKLRDKLTAAEEKLAKIYATEPVAWRSESYCSINMALSPPFGQVAVLLIPKPQEPT